MAKRTRVGDGFAGITEPTTSLQGPTAQIAVSWVDIESELHTFTLRQFDY